MFKYITDRFFILDADCAFATRLRDHEASKKLYGKLIEEFCAEQNIEMLSYNYRCDGKLAIKVSEQQREIFRAEYGSPLISGTPLRQRWDAFLKEKKEKRKFVGDPYLLRYMPWTILNFQYKGFLFGERIYVAVDGDGIESAVFPGWCLEITGADFYKALMESRAQDDLC